MSRFGFGEAACSSSKAGQHAGVPMPRRGFAMLVVVLLLSSILLGRASETESLLWKGFEIGCGVRTLAATRA